MRCVDWNCDSWANLRKEICRTLHEVRGLKLTQPIQNAIDAGSHLTWGAWIEIARDFAVTVYKNVAPYMRCVDWNKNIKISVIVKLVAPYMRCVDWNFLGVIVYDNSDVAPYMRCVDWNWYTKSGWLFTEVAPYMRCVDWNRERNWLKKNHYKSHLTWGAWIEIPSSSPSG